MRRFDVTIAGELNLDLIFYGLPDELPPERELLAEGMMLTLGGSSTIVAHNLAALGSRVGFISRIGDDQLGQIALDRLAAGNVDVSKLRRVPGPIKTGLTLVLQRPSWRNMVTYAGTTFEINFDDLDLEYLSSARHFHYSSFYLQRGLQPRIVELFQKLKAAGLTISLDTNDDPDDRWEADLQQALRYVDVFLPNAREATRITGTNDLEAAIAKLASQVPIVVVKLGSEGALAQQGGQRFTAPAVRVDPVDAVGAGDSFNAGFLHEYVRGSDLQNCLAGGNVAGALSTTKSGGTEAFCDSNYRDDFLRANAQSSGNKRKDESAS